MKKYTKPDLFIEKLTGASVISTCTVDASELGVLPSATGFYFASTKYGCSEGHSIPEYNAEHPETPICYHAPADNYGIFGS